MSRKKKLNTLTTTPQEKENTKVIVINGAERGIIPYHLAMLLMKANPNVEILLIDNSIEADVFLAIPGYKTYAGNFERTTVVRNKAYSKKAFEYFDYVIVYNGKCVDKEYLDKADYLLALSDYSVQNKELLNKLEVNENTKKMALFIDKITTKVAEKTMLHNTCFNKEDQIEVIEFSEVDFRGKVEFSYNGEHAFVNMSKDYQNALEYVASFVLERDIKSSLKRK